MTSKERHDAAAKAARRRGGSHPAGGDRQVGRTIKAQRDLASRRGRGWINGREVGGVDPRYIHLSRSYD